VPPHPLRRCAPDLRLDGRREACGELRHAPAGVADALDLATSFEAWDRLRTEQRLARERAQAAVERMVLCLVGERAR